MRNILTKLLIAALVVLTSSSLYAQGEKVSVSGKVVDAANGEPLIGVTILTDSMQGVTTFVDGTYTIDAAQGTTLTFSYMGYKDVTWKV
ncbi:MAG: carboxypeptidase-like regulatory domain-containing protein, partial [Tidjanibacter sp.]|nr:carboxypeptidase-like regulatory domain-containing protein [Tidjanibacter sp.]